MADAWRQDLKLREDMEKYVRQRYKREEALEFLKRDFPMYAWSIRSLDRGLRCFEIYCNNSEVPLSRFQYGRCLVAGFEAKRRYGKICKTGI